MSNARRKGSSALGRRLGLIQMRKHRMGECTYCGQVRALTRDHVPPKCIIPPALRQNLTTVPACDECNHAGGEDDEYFRDRIGMHTSLAGDPVIAPVRGSMLRSAALPEKRAYALDFLRSFEQSAILAPDGRPYRVFTVAGDSILRVVIRTTAGIFRRYWGHRVPDGYQVRAQFGRHLDFLRNPLLDQYRRDLLARDPLIEIPGVYNCRAMGSSAEHDFTLWWHEFFGNVTFMAATFRPSSSVLDASEPPYVDPVNC